jgi:hypothetical protein
LNYWRTKDGSEIDFILNLPEGLQAIEVKKSFPGRMPSSLAAFRDAYSQEHVAPAKLVALEGKPAGDGMVFPWVL